MCFAALSRKRFLEKYRPGHDRVFWEPELGKWLSYSFRAYLDREIEYLRVHWLWHMDTEQGFTKFGITSKSWMYGAES